MPKIKLKTKEQKIASLAFRQLYKLVLDEVSELYSDLNKRNFALNRILIKLSEMLDEEVESNF